MGAKLQIEIGADKGAGICEMGPDAVPCKWKRTSYTGYECRLFDDWLETFRANDFIDDGYRTSRCKACLAAEVKDG